MSLRDRVRTALYLILHGDVPATVRARIAAEIAEDDADINYALYERFGEAAARAAINDHMAARVLVEHFPLGQPRLTLLTGGA